MCGRLLRLWHASYGYRDRVAGRDKGKMARLMLIGIPRWCDVGDCPRLRGVGQRVMVARAPVDEAWLGCPAISVSSGGVGGSRLSDVGDSCRTSRRGRGRCDGALAGLQPLPGPQYQRR